VFQTRGKKQKLKQLEEPKECNRKIFTLNLKVMGCGHEIFNPGPILFGVRHACLIETEFTNLNICKS
jgi:hypothetical protein